MKNSYSKYLGPQSLLTISLALYDILLLFIAPLIAMAEPLPYNPVDNIAIACGSSGNLSAIDGRRWYGDINSTFVSLADQNEASISLAVVELAREVDSIPYTTARLSHSEFTYLIPVSTPGPKFIRLYFYSGAYQNFDPSNAIFSVKAHQFVLLSNFNPFLNTTDSFGRKDIVKEFHVSVEKSIVCITFTPLVPGSFAFVNGIEVVSTPSDLFFWHPDDTGPTFVGQQSQLPLRNNSILENVYRINIGGRAVPPVEDTGLFRSWDGENEKVTYLTVPGTSVLPVIVEENLKFTVIPPYIAPTVVYQTARSMGTYKYETRSYNLTWEFPVDFGFEYMVRLHFCETGEVNSTGDRVFLIFIANQIADEHADVIYWSGGQYVPYFKDYIVSMLGNGEGRKLNLSLKLQANPKDWRTTYKDAILNGVEIFKLNGATPSQQQRKRKNNNRIAIVGILSVVIFVAVILSILGFLISRWRKVKDSKFSIKFTKTRGSCLSSEQCRYFSLAEIKVATNNFDDTSIIGVGGFGNVYKGHIDGGATSIAIKRLKPESSQGAHEFKTEIEMLSQLRHLNLVSLIGYCDENREMILVYEYMPRGTLSNHLYNTENRPLAWKQRLDICIGAANGLHYLHAGMKHTIIHRDVKTTNILLDEKWVAKISDFGLSKVRPSNTSKAHISTMVKGSIGYLDPEYYRMLQLTEKSDVYSFGVVLFEVLCGRPPVMSTVERSQMSLAQWAVSCYHEGTLDQIVDPYLKGKITSECLKKFGEIAVTCLQDNGAERPSMKEVVWGLESAMELQQISKGNARIGGETGPEINENGTPGRHTCSWGDTSGAVFSEINELQGR